MATRLLPSAELPVLAFESQQEWERWLAHNYSLTSGIWLKFAKKGSALRSVSYAEAVESALCYGWIDGQAKSLDALSWLQRFTPRRARSMWSKVNREKVKKLIADGRMQPPGFLEIERAKADGRWEAAYDSPATAQVPDDFQAALDGNARAKEFFSTLSGSRRYAVLHRIQIAKKAETRAQRIMQFVQMLERGETL